MPELEYVEQLARRVVADIADDTAFVLAVDWINERYQEYVRRCRPSHLIEVGELNLPAYVTGGSVSVTRGSPIVTGDTTAAALWTHDLIGWHFRTKTAWYRIKSIDQVALTLTLESGFGEDSVTAGNYFLVKRFHSLPENVRWIGTMIHPRRRIPIENIHRDTLDRLYTERLAIGTLIQFWCDQGVDPETGARRIEIYPPTKEYEMIAFSYRSDPAKLDIDMMIPRFVDPYVLKEGALVNAFRYKAAKAADAGKADVAQFYANWHERQETKWSAKMRSMAIAEKGADDGSIILQVLKTRGGYGAGGDIATAREQVYAQWTPLT